MSMTSPFGVAKLSFGMWRRPSCGLNSCWWLASPMDACRDPCGFETYSCGVPSSKWMLKGSHAGNVTGVHDDTDGGTDESPYADKHR